MSKHVLRAVALAVALLPLTWAAAAPLSLDQAVELAVQRSQMTRSARAGAMSAAEMARAAGQQLDPMLSIGIDNLPVTGSNRFSSSAEDMTMKRIGIVQEWVSGEKRSAREAAVQAVAERESVMEKVAAGEARMQTAMAYVEAYYAGKALALAMLNEMHAREALEAGKGRLATVAGSSGEVLALAGAVGSAEDESGDVRQQQSVAAVGLQRWTGTPVDELSEPRLAVVPSLDQYVASHPLVVARQRDIEVTRQELQVTRLGRRPNWTYELSYGQRQGRPDLMSFMVNIPLTLAPAERQDRETAAKQGLVDKAEAELEELRRAAAGEYLALASHAGRLQERIERFLGGVVAPLKQRTAATLAAYRSNQTPLATLFEARNAEVEAQRKLLGLQRDLARARAQLVFKPISQGGAP
jgi:cobalt-zinc-cadmium efflux system outer membrane protein